MARSSKNIDVETIVSEPVAETTETNDETTVLEPVETVTETYTADNKPAVACFSFDYYILDERNQIAVVKTVLSAKGNEADAIADASEQLAELNWRYTGNFKRL